MSDEEQNGSAKQTPIRDVQMEPGAEDLLDTPAMQPYMRIAIAMMQGKDLGSAVEEIAALSLEQRYVWRVSSALKWAFSISTRSTLRPIARRFLQTIGSSYWTS